MRIKLLDTTSNRVLPDKVPWYQQIATWELGGRITPTPDKETYLDVLNSGHLDDKLDPDAVGVMVDLETDWNGAQEGDWEYWKEIHTWWNTYMETFRKRYPDKHIGIWNYGGYAWIQAYDRKISDEERIRYEGWYSAQSFIPKMAGLTIGFMDCYFKEKAGDIEAYINRCENNRRLFERQGIEIAPVIMPRREVKTDNWITEFEMISMISYLQDKYKRLAIWNHHSDEWDRSQPCIQVIEDLL